MQIGSIVAVYFIAWWICLLVVLPFGARSQRDADNVHPGSEPGAPALLRLWPKLLATTILAGFATWGLLLVLGNPWLQEYWR